MPKFRTEEQAQGGLAAIKGDKTLAEFAEHFDVCSNQISGWKQQLQESAADVFDGGAKKKVVEPDLKVRPNASMVNVSLGYLDCTHVTGRRT